MKNFQRWLAAIIHLRPNAWISVNKNLNFVSVNIMHLMSAREGSSFVFLRDSMFPETKSRETLSFEEKQN